MERFDQKFGSLGPMIRSDEGYWISYEDFEEILKGNEEALFDVIKERNVEIEELKKSNTIKLERQEQNFLDWKEKSDSMLKVIDDKQLFLKDIQSNLQHFGDDNEELKLKNTKLFSLLIISTVLNLLIGSAITLFSLGLITL